VVAEGALCGRIKASKIPLLPLFGYRKQGHINKQNFLSRAERDDTMRITIQHDDTVINRSRAGVELTHKMLNNKLFIGIGYVGERTNMVSEARSIVSDADLKRGVKVWFIEHTTSDGKKKKVLVIPFALVVSSIVCKRRVWYPERAISSQSNYQEDTNGSHREAY
jgi:hypothetical protein